MDTQPIFFECFCLVLYLRDTVTWLTPVVSGWEHQPASDWMLAPITRFFLYCLRQKSATSQIFAEHHSLENPAFSFMKVLYLSTNSYRSSASDCSPGMGTQVRDDDLSMCRSQLWWEKGWAPAPLLDPSDVKRTRFSAYSVALKTSQQVPYVLFLMESMNSHCVYSLA